MTHRLAILCIVVVLSSTRLAHAADDPDAAAREAERKMRLPRPDAAGVSSPALEAALADPERLWQFLTAADTPYAERLAAVARGARLVPPEFVPRIVNATADLRRERDAHHWGLRPHPMDATPRPSVDPASLGRARTVLGQSWTPPREPRDYPLTFDEETAAPWPWQVEQVLVQLLPAMAAPEFPGQTSTENPASVRWMAACMTMPVTSDDEADRFVDATLGGGVMRAKSLPVMARWRQIAIDADRPRAAERIAAEVGEVARRWRDPRGRDIAELIVTDMLRLRPPGAARERAAAAMAGLRIPIREDEPLNPAPATSILAAAERAADETNGAAWLRLTAYAYGVCAALDYPPLPKESLYRGPPPPESAEAVAQLATFVEWFRAREQRLRDAAAARDAELRPLRDEMDRLAVRGER